MSCKWDDVFSSLPIAERKTALQLPSFRKYLCLCVCALVFRIMGTNYRTTYSHWQDTRELWGHPQCPHNSKSVEAFRRPPLNSPLFFSTCPNKYGDMTFLCVTHKVTHTDFSWRHLDSYTISRHPTHKMSTIHWLRASVTLCSVIGCRGSRSGRFCSVIGCTQKILLCTGELLPPRSCRSFRNRGDLTQRGFNEEEEKEVRNNIWLRVY